MNSNSRSSNNNYSTPPLRQFLSKKSQRTALPTWCRSRMNPMVIIAIAEEESAAAGRDDPAQGVMFREDPSTAAKTDDSALRFVQSIVGAA